ncbi:MAG: hypothetical protein ACLGXA_23045 [Acidobacteriota bacterium]
MRILPQIRTGAFSLSALFLGIALCVFAWGLRYKLSLYDPPHSASHNFPIAKLLSKDELPETLRPTGLAADARTLAGFLLFFSVLPGLASLIVLVPPRGPAHSPLPPRPSRLFILESGGLHSFFFRPPPIASARLLGSRSTGLPSSL